MRGYIFQSTNMICPNCKNQIAEGSAFCNICGTKLYAEQNINTPNVSPLQQPQQAYTPQIQHSHQKSNNVLVVILVVALVLAIAGGVGYFLFNKFLTSSETSIASETTEEVEIDQNQYDWLSERSVTAADLSGKTSGDLRLMRNAIFAKHGYIFKSDDLREYFSAFSWYTPQRADVTPYLSAIEKENIDFIQKFEGSKPTVANTTSKPRLSNVGFAHDYSDIVCYQRLDDIDVAGLSKAELRILRNTIFARHGRKFKAADLRNYFNSFSWYVPLYDDVPISELTPTEQHNIALIQQYE